MPTRPPQACRLRAEMRVRVVKGQHYGRAGRVFSQFTDGGGKWLILLDAQPPDLEPGLEWIHRGNLSARRGGR